MLIARLLAHVMLIVLLLHDVVLGALLVLPGTPESMYAIAAWTPLALLMWLCGIVALYAGGRRDAEPWFAVSVPLLVLAGPVLALALPIETSLLMLAAWGLGLNVPVLLVCRRLLGHDYELAYARVRS